MLRRSPLHRRTRLHAKTSLQRRTPMPRQRIRPAVPAEVRTLLTARSGGRCEIALPGCYGQATDPHHRITRGTGGRHGAARLHSDRLSGLIHCCRLCHRRVHTRVAWAHDLGLLLHEHQDPTAEPALLLAHDSIPSYLTDDGRVLSFEEARGVSRKSVYINLESQIARDERGGILHRWRYGRELLKIKVGRKQLPHGLIGDLVEAATRAGFKISEREIQWRIKCATVYATEAEVRTASTDFGSWSALRDAGFPEISINAGDQHTADLDPDDLDDIGEPNPYVEEPLFEIPGFKPVLKIRGRKVDLADASVRDAIEYRDMCREMHANFGRTVAQVEESVAAMIEGADGDLDANAVEAWKQANGDLVDDDDPPFDSLADRNPSPAEGAPRPATPGRPVP